MPATRLSSSLLAALATLLLSAGAPGPAAAMSEKAEIKLGREQHQKVLAEMGAYDDDAVQGYVTELGHKLALKSDWPRL